MKQQISEYGQKFAALFGLTALMFSFLPASLAADQELPDGDYNDEVMVDFEGYMNPFPDTDLDDLEGQAAAELFRRGIIEGQGTTGRFEGSWNVNRAEALQFLLRTRYANLPDADLDAEEYCDVETGEWFHEYVAVGTDLGIINGYPDGCFRPERTVNTVEFLKMLTLTFDLELNLSYSYTDVDSTQWYARYLGVAKKYNLFPTRTTRIMPTDALTRDEVAVAMYQYLKNRTDLPDDNETDMSFDLAVKSMANATYSSDNDDVIVWQGTLTADNEELMAVVFDQLQFKNFGTAADADIDNFTLNLKGDNLSIEAKELNLTSGQRDMINDVVTFTDLFANDEIHIRDDSPIEITLRADISEELSATAPTLQMELNLEEFEVRNTGDDFFTVTRTSTNRSSLTITLTEDDTTTGGNNGDDDLLETYSRTPSSRILVAGEEENVVAGVKLRSNLEDAEIDELAFEVEGFNTSGTLGEDVANDADAIDSVRLLYADGSPVLKTGGQEATASVNSSGMIVFTNLDLVAEEDEDLYVFVAVDLADIGGSGTAASGMAFSINLSTDNGDHEIRGGTSGALLNITSIGGSDSANQGEVMYVLTNLLTAEVVSTSEVLTSGDQRELMRFRLNTSDTSRDTFLRAVAVQVATTGGATVENLGLYNSDNELIAFAEIDESDGTYVLTVGIEDDDADQQNDPGAAAANNLTFNTSGLQTLPAAGDDMYEEISNGEVFTIRGDVSTDGSGDQIVTTIEINSADASDGITWRDEGGDNGEDGATIKWIIMEDESELEHVLRN